MNRNVSSIIAGCLLLGSAPSGQASESGVLQRLQALEALVAQLQAELARRPAPAATVPPKPAAAKAAASGGEWDEPEVDKKAEGRDEEARRRLLVLETQGRKSAAETAKREEEQKDRFKFDFSGKYKAQVNSRHNFNLDNPAQQWKYDNAAFADHRFSLQIDAAYESLLTRLVLDKGNFVMDWKEDGEGTLERWGQFQTVGSQLVRELFVQYTGPVMVRAGRQNWDIAQKVVLDGPVDGLRLQVPFGQLPWGQTTLSEGYIAVAGGWGGYTSFNATGGRLGGSRQEVFSASNKLDAWYADLDIRPSRALRFQPYILKAVDDGGTTDADLNLDKDFNAATMPRDGGFHPLWTGLAVSAEAAPWKFDAEAVLLSGSYSADRKLSANALLLKARRDFGKLGSLANFAAGLQFGRGSGNGTSTANSGTMRNFSALFTCRERNKFGNIFSEDIRAGYYFWDSNLANVTFLRLEATLEPGKGLKITPSLTRLRTTQEVFAGRGPVLDWSQGAATSTATTRDIGWEADLNMAFPIYKRLDGFVNFGYFRPGAVYARPDGSNPRPAWEMVLGAELKF